MLLSAPHLRLSCTLCAAQLDDEELEALVVKHAELVHKHHEVLGYAAERTGAKAGGTKTVSTGNCHNPTDTANTHSG